MSTQENLVDAPNATASPPKNSRAMLGTALLQLYPDARTRWFSIARAVARRLPGRPAVETLDPSSQRPRRRRLTRFIPLLLLLAPKAARAQFSGLGGGGGNMPWEGPLETLMESLTGPVAKVVGVVAIFVVGMGIAFAESGGMMRKALWLVMGLTIAFNAASLASDFLGGPA